MKNLKYYYHSGVKPSRHEGVIYPHYQIFQGDRCVGMWVKRHGVFRKIKEILSGDHTVLDGARELTKKEFDNRLFKDML